jgi:ectoine hydroxylase-related dioxygenase (phytanoyl-CoA dioxygenase family)
MAETDTPARHVTTIPPTASVEQIKAATDRDGAVIVQQVIAPDLLTRLNAELDPLLDATDSTGGYADDESRAAFYGRQTRRLQSVPARCDAAAEVMVDERILGWVGSCLTWGTEFQLSSAQVIDIGPGQPAQVLHRDEDLWPELIPVAPGEFTVSCMLALSDFTEETGATRLVPGTRRVPSGDERTYSHEDTVPAVMAAGDALFFTGTVVHGGGANLTPDQRRRGLALSFVLGWLRPEEANNLSMPVERAKTLPPRLRELRGFAGYRAEMGVIGQLDMEDPYVALFGEPRPAIQKVRQNP